MTVTAFVWCRVEDGTSLIRLSSLLHPNHLNNGLVAVSVDVNSALFLPLNEGVGKIMIRRRCLDFNLALFVLLSFSAFTTFIPAELAPIAGAQGLFSATPF